MYLSKHYSLVSHSQPPKELLYFIYNVYVHDCILNCGNYHRLRVNSKVKAKKNNFLSAKWSYI